MIHYRTLLHTAQRTRLLLIFAVVRFHFNALNLDDLTFLIDTATEANSPALKRVRNFIQHLLG